MAHEGKGILEDQ